MTFGPVMRVVHPEFAVTLAPPRRDAMPQLVDGMSRMSVTRYTVSRFGVGWTPEDAEKNFDDLRSAHDGIAWGIHVRELGDGSQSGAGEPTRLVGITDAFSITNGATRVATTGSMIVAPDLWGRGIASACHRARTWYLFSVLGFDALRSVYFSANTASARAVARVGYVQVGLHRHGGWYRGEALHDVITECVNPSDAAWARWWGEDPVPPEFVAARERTRAALEWAEQHVELL
ncbi:GNAT family N-acetyltransferase [Micrococcales bacterium 31B]|nr:GNAT family N-acetyltransferase [Micrococcales bacterium 31B]